jgi:capsular exopolysaccharide synthesis family protein
MSRIFDALRRSEQDRKPGEESILPAALTNAPGQVFANPQGTEVPPPELENEPAPSVDERLEELVRSARESTGMPNFAIEQFVGEKPASPEAPAEAVVVEQKIDLSLLKVVPLASIPSPRLVVIASERGLGAEKFRVLGARLSNIRLSKTLGVLQVTSSVVGEGKTLTSVNLAMTLAKRFDQKVLLAEGDLRKPAVCKMLGMTDKPGIGEWWEQPERPITDFILRIGETGMCLLPAGDVAHPASVLQSPRIAELITGLAKQFDWIIIDTPPLLPMADSNLWSRLSDGTLLVVRKGTVSRTALKKAVESIDNPKLVGIVLNDASDYDRVNYYDQYYTPRGEKVGEAISR